MTGSITLVVLAATFILIALAALAARRVRAHDRFDLGSVSQQWLTGHRGDDR